MKKVFFFSLIFIAVHSFAQCNTTPAKAKAATSISDIVAINSNSTGSLLPFKVLSYTVFYQPKGDDAVTLANNGAAFTPEVKKIIQRAKAGDVYYIEDIKVMGPDNLTRKIPGIAFKID